MSRTSTLILLGVLVILAPFSGLPIAIRSLLAVIFGACVLGIGLSIRAQEARNARAQVPAEAPQPEPLSAPQEISPI
ncbi:MAG: hypothetical protein WCV89_03630 [Candidatus Paceibacterota bacterium]